MGLVPPESSNYYDLLEISPTATSVEINAAYSRARATYSPDSPALYSMFTPQEARELLKMIEEAYSILSNQSKRQSYDLSLARRGHPAFAGKLSEKSEQRSAARKATINVVPDHGPEEPARVKAFHSKDSLPDGFAKTRFGAYEVDPVFEQEMATMDECPGPMLKKIRLYKKVSLEQLSDFIRISKSNIGAVESDAFDALPATVFVRGFVVQICRALNLDEKKVVDAYMKHFRKNSGA